MHPLLGLAHIVVDVSAPKLHSLMYSLEPHSFQFNLPKLNFLSHPKNYDGRTVLEFSPVREWFSKVLLQITLPGATIHNAYCMRRGLPESL